MEAEAPLGVFARYLQAAVAHPEAHGVHVDVVGLRGLRGLLVLRESLYKWSWGVLVLKDCSNKTREREERAGSERESASTAGQGLPPPPPDSLGTLMTTFSPLRCRMFLVSVLKQTTNVLSGLPRNPQTEDEFDNTALRGTAPPSDKSPKEALQKNHEGFPAASPAGSCLRTSPSLLSKPPSRLRVTPQTKLKCLRSAVVWPHAMLLTFSMLSPKPEPS